MAGSSAVLSCNSKAAKHQVTVQLKKIDVEQSDTKCFPKNPNYFFDCKAEIEEAKLVIDGKHTFHVKNESLFNVQASVHFDDGKPAKMVFRNITSTTKFGYGFSLSAIPCGLLKNPVWPLFSALYDKLMEEFMRSRIPSSCLL